MAKQTSGYLSGFSGRLGPAVGYMWNGKWCLRSHQPLVRNPRTAAQEAHRSLFRQEVQLAARMRWAVTTTLTEAAREAGMTSYNLFVSLNQGAFRLEDNQLAVDWRQLQLSVGPVAPVSLLQAVAEEGNVLEVSFEKNPLGLAARSHDEVRLYVYAPATGGGFLSAPVYRRDKRLRVSLPDELAGEEVQLWLMVHGERGDWSMSTYGGSLTLTPGAFTESENSEEERIASAAADVAHDQRGQREAEGGGDRHQGAAGLGTLDALGAPDTPELASGEASGAPHALA